MIDVCAVILSATGFLLFIATTAGLIRFPDFYTRMHAAGKGDTVAAVAMIAGLALLELDDLSWTSIQVVLKTLFILVFIFMANPTATHALMDAGYETGTMPLTRETLEEEGPR